jgi:hypothetical protein
LGGNLILQGSDIVIQIDGCFFLSIESEIIITLTEEQMKQLGSESGTEKVLITASDEGCLGGVDLNDVKASARPSKKSCKRVETERGSQSNQNTLALIFKLDSSRCNMWWIILVSVLGGIILIVIVIIAVIAINPTIRAKVQPFWRKPKP